LRHKVKQLGRWKRKHGRKKSSLPIPKEIEVGGKKEKKIIHPHCKRESLEKKKKKKNCSPVAKEKEVGRKITNCSSFYFSGVF
jgi:hypothetical protein